MRFKEVTAESLPESPGERGAVAGSCGHRGRACAGPRVSGYPTWGACRCVVWPTVCAGSSGRLGGTCLEDFLRLDLVLAGGVGGREPAAPGSGQETLEPILLWM